MKKQLLECVGQRVMIGNMAYDEMDDSKIQFNFAGELEYSECEYAGGHDEFYCRVGDDFMAGAMGITFQEKDVVRISKMTYDVVRITLK